MKPDPMKQVREALVFYAERTWRHPGFTPYCACVTCKDGGSKAAEALAALDAELEPPAAAANTDNTKEVAL